MSGVISVGISAEKLSIHSGIIRMGAGIYIHDMTPEMASQWIETLTTITKETA
jgi:hypothetical protein